MPEYTYRARAADGREVAGTLTAQTEERAAALLRNNNLLPLQIAERKTLAATLNINVLGGVNRKDLILFTRQLGSMIQAGVPILQALRALMRQVSKDSFRKLLTQLTFDVESGLSLSAAMAKYPNVFSAYILGLVRTGEASGQLADSLNLLSDYIEQDYTFVRKVRVALIYPAFILTTVIILVVIMFSFVVPQLVTLFEDAGVTLPLTTRILIAVTTFVARYWYVLIAIAGALALLFRSYYRTPEGRYALSSLVLRLPVIRGLFQKIFLTRLTSILHTLLKTDVPVIEALNLARDAVGNRVYQRILDRTTQAIRDGASMSSVWEQESYMPPMLTTMVAVGERSGEVERAFSEANRFFKRDVEDVLGSLSVLLEPILIIILGIGVGFVVAAVLLPIYNLVVVL